MLLIVSLQSLNIMKIDFINFITFIVKSEAKFMWIFVDYFIQYLFADVMSFAIFENIMIFFEKSVMQNFEWSRMMYFDNESHFKRDFNFKLKEQKMKHHFTSINHSVSIKFAKRYVKIVLKMFKVILQHHVDMIFE